MRLNSACTDQSVVSSAAEDECQRLILLLIKSVIGWCVTDLCFHCFGNIASFVDQSQVAFSVSVLNIYHWLQS